MKPKFAAPPLHVLISFTLSLMRPGGCYPAPGQTRVSEVSVTCRGRVSGASHWWGHGAGPLMETPRCW